MAPPTTPVTWALAMRRPVIVPAGAASTGLTPAMCLLAASRWSDFGPTSASISFPVVMITVPFACRTTVRAPRT